jgi:hypothetical protein
MIKLGSKVKDKVTGFEGIATGYVTYLTGCNQVLVAPKVGKDGVLKDSAWIDEQRLVVDSKAATVKLDNSKANGFDAVPPKR